MKRLSKPDLLTEKEESWSPDGMIEILESYKDRQIGRGVPLSETDIKSCLTKVKKVLAEEKSLLELKAPIKVIGDMYDTAAQTFYFH